ncbi:hypothetical protein ACHAW6_006999 [Cyclotella cf. meneghiniana]
MSPQKMQGRLELMRFGRPTTKRRGSQLMPCHKHCVFRSQKLRVLLAILVALCIASQYRKLVVQYGTAEVLRDESLVRRRDIVKNTIFYRRSSVEDDRSILHVFQYGSPRTATTSQFNMVCVSLFLHVQIHHPELLNNTICNMGGKVVGESEAVKFFSNVPQAFKSHIQQPDPKHFKPSTVVFTTDVTKEGAVQKKEELRRQGFNVGIVQDMETLAEVDISGMVKRYAAFFSLTPQHVDTMTSYFQLWSKLRQCCGMQMSKYFRNELLPASLQVKDMKRHGFCGSLDIDSLETQYMNSDLYKLLNNYPLVRKINRPAMVDGDLDGSYCSRYSDAVRKHGNSGNMKLAGLNSRYDGIEHNWEEGSKNPFEVLRKKVISDLPPKESSEEPPLSPWVQDYISFHQSSIVNGKLAENSRYIVYECKDGEELCGGAGDRMIGMIKMFYLAMCTRRVLLIDAPFPIPLTDVFNPAQIEWNASFPETRDFFTDMDYSSKIWLREKVRGYRVPRTNGAPRKKGLDEIWESRLMVDHLRKGKWSKMADKVSLATVAREAFRAMFQFNRVVISRAQELKAEAGISGPYLGMHIRKGDASMLKSERQKNFTRETDDDQIVSCYSQMKLSHPNAFEIAYLASDDIQTKEKIAHVDSSIHFAHLRPFHIDKSARKGSRRFNFHAIDSTTVYNGVIDTWAEMLVMAESACLILSQSMFTFATLYMRDPRACAVPLHLCNDPNDRKGDKEYFAENLAERGFVTAIGKP